LHGSLLAFARVAFGAKNAAGKRFLQIYNYFRCRRPTVPERTFTFSARMPSLLRNPRYEFSETVAGLPQPFAFDPYLFLRHDHLLTQSEDALRVFQLLDQNTNTIVAHFPVFQASENRFYSPGRASFGGLQIAPDLLPEVLFDFVKQVQNTLKAFGNGTEIRLKTAPVGYAPAEAALIANTFLNLGFQVSASEVNHHIPVSEIPFAEQAYDAARRRLEKCRQAGFEFQEENAGFLQDAYAFIKSCREEKGHALSLSFEALGNLFRQFPAAFRLFSVRTMEGELAACTVAVRVNKDVLYNFYPASPLRFNHFSPAVMLTEGLYGVCQKAGFGILDLGTSALPEGPNFPLMNFKKHLGGQPSLKLSFIYRS
jgi:hypothetical protein